ncbi:MAG TPA: methyltransferase [Gaiellaceae bacterium]|nr:methyltransferase [Gaiellaceae bacterium]
MRGALAARTLGLVVELGIPEALADGPRPIDELADGAGADTESLHRLLRALASDGVFAEEEPGVFGHTAASEALCEGGRSGEFARLFGGVWHRTAGELQADGRPTFERIHGTDYWSWLAAHPAERAIFDQAMVEGKERRTDRLEVVEWRGDETVVDVGGGNGSLLVALLERRPSLHGIVLDLPETVRDEKALGERIEFVEGSFFERVPEGDVFVLGTVLHDWDDESATRILQTIRRSAREGSRLLVIDRVLPPGNEPDGSKWLDILMLALLGGKERTEGQWRELLAAGGFEPVRFHEALIEAVPAG